jgi:hypothetical protein
MAKGKCEIKGQKSNNQWQMADGRWQMANGK